MWVLVESLQYPLYLYDFSLLWIVWWLVMCELWLKDFAQVWHLQSSLDWLLWYIVRCELWRKVFPHLFHLEFFSGMPCLLCFFRSIFCTAVTLVVSLQGDLSDVLQGRSSARKFCHSHCTYGISLLCVPWWSISGNSDWMHSHSHCICRDWVSLHCAFWCSLRAEWPWKGFPHSKHTCGSSSLWMDCCWLWAVRSLKPYPPLPHF